MIHTKKRAKFFSIMSIAMVLTRATWILPMRGFCAHVNRLVRLDCGVGAIIEPETNEGTLLFLRNTFDSIFFLLLVPNHSTPSRCLLRARLQSSSIFTKTHSAVIPCIIDPCGHLRPVRFAHDATVLRSLTRAKAAAWRLSDLGC